MSKVCRARVYRTHLQTRMPLKSFSRHSMSTKRASTDGWYDFAMTTVEILFRYAAQPTDAVASALGSTREVYGIRSLKFDRAAQTLRVEYDATRLSAAVVTKLVRQAGLDIEEELPLFAPPAPEPVAAS